MQIGHMPEQTITEQKMYYRHARQFSRVGRYPKASGLLRSRSPSSTGSIFDQQYPVFYLYQLTIHLNTTFRFGIASKILMRDSAKVEIEIAPSISIA